MVNEVHASLMCGVQPENSGKAALLDFRHLGVQPPARNESKRSELQVKLNVLVADAGRHKRERQRLEDKLSSTQTSNGRYAQRRQAINDLLGLGGWSEQLQPGKAPCYRLTSNTAPLPYMYRTYSRFPFCPCFSCALT